MANLALTIDSYFRPYSFEERIKPYLLYKDAYEKAEAAYDELSDKADTFSYLANKLGDDPNNRAAMIYKGYADELHRQADDLAMNGLNMSNRRALNNLRRRYQGEIGQLVKADERMKEVQKKRDALQAAGKQMFYGVDNLDINDFLGDGSQFNGYAIDADDLRKEAAAYAQNVSSGMYESDLIPSTNKYFLEQVQRHGYRPEILAAWRNNLESIPEFNRAVDDIIKARGIDTNLKGRNYEEARQTIINGIMEGTVSKTTSDFTSNPGVLTAAQQEAADRAAAKQAFDEEQLDFTRSVSGYENKGTKENPDWVYNPNKDQQVKKAQAVAEAKIVRDENGKPINTRSGSSRTRARKAKPSKQFDAKGNAYDVTSSNNTNRGKIISYEEAISKYPAVGQYISAEDKDLYDFFENEDFKRVNVIGHPDNTGNTSDEDFIMNESDLESENQL